MKITVLCENTRKNPSLTAEHGLSIFIETADARILFDMGQTDAFVHNASVLGVDLSSADFAVLSHGHYDHGGGLAEFLKINKTAPVYISRFAFGDHFNGSEKYIGLDKSLSSDPRLVFTENHMPITAGCELISLPSASLPYPIEPFGLGVMRGGTIYNEDFRHEQFLRIHEDGRDFLFSGCAHTGVMNLTEIFKPDVFVGGFHFSKLDPSGEELKNTAKKLSDTGIRFYTCHCTGIEQFSAMKQILRDRLTYISTGFSENI